MDEEFEECTACDGRGYQEDGKFTECPRCNGVGGWFASELPF